VLRIGLQPQLQAQGRVAGDVLDEQRPDVAAPAGGVDQRRRALTAARGGVDPPGVALAVLDQEAAELVQLAQLALVEMLLEQRARAALEALAVDVFDARQGAAPARDLWGLGDVQQRVLIAHDPRDRRGELSHPGAGGRR
jgi:hypothetical protein